MYINFKGVDAQVQRVYKNLKEYTFRNLGTRNEAGREDQQDRIETIQKRSRKFRDILVLVFRTSPSVGLR